MNSIKKNVVCQIAYQFLTILLPLITSPYIARVLGANGVGIYSYTFSIASYFVLFAKLGIHVHGNRAIAIVRDDPQKLNQTFSDLLAVHLGASAISIFVYIGYVLVGNPAYRIIAAVQILYVVAEMLEINWLYFGLEQFKITVTGNTVIKIGTLISIFLFIKDTADVWKYCMIMAVSAVLSEMIMWMFLHKYVKIVRPNWENAKKQIIPLVGFFIPSIAVSLYKVMDKIMLGMLSDTAQVGYYNNSEQIISAALGFVTAVGSAMMPRMSNLAVNGNEKEGKKIIAISMKIVMLTVIAMAAGIIGVANIFAPVFWGNEFKACSLLMQALALSMLFTSFANVIRTQYLIPKQKDKLFRYSVIAGACMNLIVNYLLIPHYQAFGAAIGTIAAESTVCLIQAIYATKDLPITDYLKKLIPYTFFAAIMSFTVFIIGNNMECSIRTFAIQILSGIGIYTILTGIYLYATKDELWTNIVDSIRKL